MADSNKVRPEFLINDKYRLMRKIGAGSFGDIYLGINHLTGEVSTLFIVGFSTVPICVSGS